MLFVGRKDEFNVECCSLSGIKLWHSWQNNIRVKVRQNQPSRIRCFAEAEQSLAVFRAINARTLQTVKVMASCAARTREAIQGRALL